VFTGLIAKWTSATIVITKVPGTVCGYAWRTHLGVSGFGLESRYKNSLATTAKYLVASLS